MVEKFDYPGMLDTANELIDLFGQDAVAMVPGTPTGEPQNQVPGAPTYLPIVLVEIDYEIREIDGSNVLRGDKQAIIKASAPALIPTATIITYGGVDHKVIGDVNPLNPGGLLMLYIAQLRAA